jgi:hypothetical protein
MKDFSRYKIYTIDDRTITDWGATEEFIEQLASLLNDQAEEGFFLSAITQFHGEHVVILKR